MASMFPSYGAPSGLFGGLPDWLWQDPRMLESRPNAMAGGTPAGSFEDRWGPVLSALKSGQFDPQGGNQGAPQQVTPDAMQAWRDSTPMPAMAYDAPQGPPGRQPLAGMNPPQQPPQSPAGGYGGDLSSPPTIGAPTPQATFPELTRAPVNPSFGDRLGAGLAGFANAGSPMQAIGNLFGGMFTGQRQDAMGRGEQAQKEMRAATYQAVMRATNGDQAQALAAASNPEVFKALLPQLFEKPKFQVIREGIAGDKEYGYPPAPPLTYDRTGMAPGVAGAPIVSQDPFLAPGVKEVDQSLAGQAFLDQYSPKVRQAVKDYVAGRTLPTGNPRKGYVQEIKAIAGKYAADIGLPGADDSTFMARRTMRNQLSSTSPASMGGQINFGNTALVHLDGVAKAAEALDNKDLGFTWGTQAWNNLRGLTTAQAAKVNKLQTELQHYGQEITKFYAGSPGGEAERNRFLNSIAAAKSPQELAAAIDAERELIPGRMKQLEEQIRTTLGEDGVKQYPVLRPGTQESVDRVGHAVHRMSGGQLGSAGPGATPATPATPASKGPNADLINEMKRRGLLK